MPILVFLGLSVLELHPIYATEQTDVRRQTKASLNAPAYRGGDIKSCAGSRHNMPPPPTSWQNFVALTLARLVVEMSWPWPRKWGPRTHPWQHVSSTWSPVAEPNFGTHGSFSTFKSVTSTGRPSASAVNSGRYFHFVGTYLIFYVGSCLINSS